MQPHKEDHGTRDEYSRAQECEQQVKNQSGEATGIVGEFMTLREFREKNLADLGEDDERAANRARDKENYGNSRS